MTIPVHLCSKCEMHPATVKVVKLQHGSAKQIWLCTSCAAEESPYSALNPPSSLPGAPKTLEDVLAGLFGKGTGEAAARPGATDLICRNCGLPYEAYKSSLLLGCPVCYDSFADQLRIDLRKFHGSVQHRGRPLVRAQGALSPPETPVAALPGPGGRNTLDLEQSLDKLRRQLREAVDEEDYRLAAELKNRIRALESERDEASLKAESGPGAPAGGDSHGE
jgi:protein arginine kinase activator